MWKTFCYIAPCWQLSKECLEVNARAAPTWSGSPGQPLGPRFPGSFAKNGKHGWFAASENLSQNKLRSYQTLLNILQTFLICKWDVLILFSEVFLVKRFGWPMFPALPTYFNKKVSFDRNFSMQFTSKITISRFFEVICCRSSELKSESGYFYFRSRSFKKINYLRQYCMFKHLNLKPTFQWRLIIWSQCNCGASLADSSWLLRSSCLNKRHCRVWCIMSMMQTSGCSRTRLTYYLSCSLDVPTLLYIHCLTAYLAVSFYSIRMHLLIVCSKLWLWNGAHTCVFIILPK